MNILYVNETLVDLYPDTKIAINIKAIEAGKIQVRTVNYTNNFTLPFTETNDILFSYAKDERSRTNIPYRYQSFKLIQNGIETFKGQLILKSVDEKGYKIQLVDGLYDIFAIINDKKFKELQAFGQTGWDPIDIDDYRDTTEGIISAIMYFGYTDYTGTVIYNDNFFLPSFYYHTAIKAILSASGCTLSGDILTDSRFTDLIIPYPGESYVPIINTPYDSSTTSPGQSVLSPTSTTGAIVSWNNASNISFNQWTNNYDNSTTVNFQIDLNLTSITYFNATAVYAKLIYNDGSDHVIATSSNITGSSGTISFNEDILTDRFGYVYVRVYSNAASSPTATFTIASSSTFEATGPSSTSANWDDLWPETPCKELLQDFCTRFNIVFKLKNSVLYIKTLEEILADRLNVMDWSEKLVKSFHPIDFSLDLAQTNYLQYSNETPDDTYGRGELTIDNELLPFDKVIYTSPFATSDAYVTSFWDTIEHDIYDAESVDNTDFKNTPGLKLLTLKNRVGESSIEFDPGSGNFRTDYKIAYFIDSSKAKDTGFQYFVDQFYGKYELALQRNKVITKQYYLTEIDIQNYDPHKLIFDGEGYYLINRIINFIPGKLTEVELFKVS